MIGKIIPLPQKRHNVVKILKGGIPYIRLAIFGETIHLDSDGSHIDLSPENANEIGFDLQSKARKFGLSPAPMYDLEENERFLCQAALDNSQTMNEAAGKLGISRHALGRRIKKFGLRYNNG